MVDNNDNTLEFCPLTYSGQEFHGIIDHFINKKGTDDTEFNTCAA